MGGSWTFVRRREVVFYFSKALAELPALCKTRATDGIAEDRADARNWRRLISTAFWEHWESGIGLFPVAAGLKWKVCDKEAEVTNIPSFASTESQYLTLSCP